MSCPTRTRLNKAVGHAGQALKNPPLILKDLQKFRTKVSCQTGPVQTTFIVNLQRKSLPLNHLPPTLFPLKPSPIYGGRVFFAAAPRSKLIEPETLRGKGPDAPNPHVLYPARSGKPQERRSPTRRGRRGRGRRVGEHSRCLLRRLYPNGPSRTLSRLLAPVSTY